MKNDEYDWLGVIGSGCGSVPRCASPKKVPGRRN